MGGERDTKDMGPAATEGTVPDRLVTAKGSSPVQ